MKRLLLATAAVIALAVAAPLATAQYTTPPPATAPYTTPLPDDPLTPQDESLSAQSDTSTTMPSATAQTQTDVYTTTQGQTDVDTTAQAQTTDPNAPGTTTYDSTAGQSTYADSGMGANVATMASLDQHARDAGMAGLPMTPMEVCAPREITLTTSGTRLSRDKEHQLINAADRASVCEFQRVVIHSPSGNAEEARRLLVETGVDSSMIDVQDADAGGLEVEMHFAGIATSSEQYAAMFNPQQYASYQPSTAAPATEPYGSTSGSSYQPNTAAPSTSPPMSDDGVWLGDPNTEIPQDPTTDSMDGMSPTAGEPVVQPGMLDI